MKFEYPINFSSFVTGSELYFTQPGHQKQMGLYLGAFRLEHTYIFGGRTAHGCSRQLWKRSCRDAAGSCYALAHPAAGQLLLALAQPQAPGTTDLGLAQGFHPSMAALGLA